MTHPRQPAPAATDRAQIIEATLARAAEICGDPRDAVYARLFARRPEFEDLFLLDTDGGVRGSMLQQALECLLDLAAGGGATRSIVTSEWQRHEGYGVPAAAFMLFFEAIRDTFREALGTEWSDAAEAAWAELLADIAAMGPAGAPSEPAPGELGAAPADAQA